MDSLGVVYAKAIDDKELGIFIEGVYFGGMAQDHDQANRIATDCTNNVRGGTAIVRIMPIPSKKALIGVFKDARTRFDKLEREMIETEDVLAANATRSKRRRK